MASAFADTYRWVVILVALGPHPRRGIWRIERQNR